MKKLKVILITLTAIGVAVKVIENSKNLVCEKESNKCSVVKKNHLNYDQLGNLL